jgi:hypothetical protein
MKHRNRKQAGGYPEANMSTINRPLAFPELSRRRPIEHPFNVRNEEGASYRRAQVVLLTFGLVAAGFAAVIALRLVILLPGLDH